MAINQINKQNFPGFDKFRGLDNKFRQMQKENRPDMGPAAAYEHGREENGIPGMPKDTAKGMRVQENEALSKEDGLSDAAKEYLEKLRNTYTNMEFVISDFSSDEEADRIMGRVRTDKEYTALIDPETLEKMAADAEVASQFEEVLKGAADTFAKMTEDLGEDAKEIKRMNIIADGEGNISYSVTMRNDVSETIDALREKSKERAEEAKKEALENKENNRNERFPKNPHEITLTSSNLDELKDMVSKQIAANKEAREQWAANKPNNIDYRA